MTLYTVVIWSRKYASRVKIEFGPETRNRINIVEDKYCTHRSTVIRPTLEALMIGESILYCSVACYKQYQLCAVRTVYCEGEER
jgi:hypothetical protein